LLFAFAVHLPLAAFQPSFEIAASATNLIVTEQTAITLRLRLAALDDPFGGQTPFLNQRPPHVEASFLAPDWSPGALAPVDPKHLFEGGSRRRRDAPAFTLNNYVSNDIFSSMGDPFGMMDDDIFGRSLLGPKKTLFPFEAQRVKVDGKSVWEFTVTTAPYRAMTPGTVTIPSVRITIPLIVSVREGRDRFGRRAHVPELRETRLSTKPLTIVVGGPPTDGRPDAFCGALSSNLSVRATLDTNICTAGDPLVFTLDISGAADLASVYPPALGKLVAGDVFRVDEASVKTEVPARRGKIRLSENAKARLLDGSDLSRFEIRKPRENGLKSAKDVRSGRRSEGGRGKNDRRDRDNRGSRKNSDRGSSRRDRRK